MVGLFSSLQYIIFVESHQKPTLHSNWRVRSVFMCAEDFAVLMLETIDNKKGCDTIIIYPLNQTRGASG